MEWLKNAWMKLPLEWRKEVVSFTQTLVATFVVTVLIDVKTNDLPMSWGAVTALGAAAFRAAVKAAVNSVMKWK